MALATCIYGFSDQATVYITTLQSLIGGQEEIYTASKRCYTKDLAPVPCAVAIHKQFVRVSSCISGTN